MTTFYGILIPFLGTTLGAACVFFLRKALGDRLQRALTGFAAGVMVAASVWSLLIPAIEQSAALGRLSFLPAAVGFWIGVAFLLLLDRLVPHVHLDGEQEGLRASLPRSMMVALAVALHNLPEGMAVSVPLRREGYSRGQSFFYGQLSGVVEPIAAVLGALLVLKVRTCLPFLLAFAAGAMIYVVVEELIPESQTNENKDWMALFTLVGFSVMMVMDVALG